MNALPSYYAGVVFRSRTEARWACYFDGVGIAWEYEPEGVALPSGWYLPDFWLPTLRSWAEVKPRCGFTPLERAKCIELCEGSGLRVLLLPGPPSLRPVEMLHPCGQLAPEVSAHLVGLWGKWLHKDGAPCYCSGADDTGDWDDDAVEAIRTVRATVYTEPPAAAYLALGWEDAVPVEPEAGEQLEREGRRSQREGAA